MESSWKKNDSETLSKPGSIRDLSLHVGQDGAVIAFRGREGDLPCPPGELLRRRVEDLLPPEVCAFIRDHAGKATADGIQETFIYHQDRADGASVLEITAAVLDTPGALVRLRRTASSGAVPAAGQFHRLGSILDALPDGVAVLGPDFSLEYANPALEKIFGQRQGRTCHELFHGRTSPCPWCRAGEISTAGTLGRTLGRTWAKEWRSPWTGRTYRITDTPWRDSGGEVRTIRYLRDITECRQTEEELFRLKEMYRALVENVPDILSRFDRDLRRVYSNPALSASLGFPLERLVGQPLSTAGYGKEAIGKLEKALREVFATGTESLVELSVAIRGGTRQFSCRVVPELSKAGEVEHALVICRDVTSRNTLERQLHQARKLEALGTLTAGIAHDFNNILTPVILNTEALLFLAGGGDPIHPFVEQIHAAAGRARDLVDRLLLFGRNVAEESPTPIPLRRALEENLALLRAAIPGNVTLRTSLSRQEIRVMAIPSQITQVVSNLVHNAVYAMRDEGGTLSIRLSRKRLDAAAARPYGLQPGSYARLCISDTGCGIEGGSIERIFDPFYTTKPAGVGTGLGLAVVHGIIGKLGGAVTVRSAPGQGTTFGILVPAITLPQG